jgi:hypothetical protein
LKAELFAEGGVGFAGGVLGVDGELEFAPAPADLVTLVFQAGVHVGVRGLARVPAVKQRRAGLGRSFFHGTPIAVPGFDPAFEPFRLRDRLDAHL